ncbi:MAG: histone deacetylase [Candidatus Poribacteria bacterium]|nr:histone deacetylase [Candidatus Poribacteria bacterium]
MRRKTAFISHPDYLDHDTGFGHPERPARLEAIHARLDQSEINRSLVRLEPRSATTDEIGFAHTDEHIDSIRRIAESGGGRVDYDTAVSAKSYDIALLSAGAVLRAVDAVADGETDNAFACVRPPGHHATPNRAMGFCLFNNVAVAARYAQRVKGLERVLIIDWDVHHGNGTQDVFYGDGSVFYFSIHQHPLYPGTGMAHEVGEGGGNGATLNIPVPAGSNDDDYVEAFEQRLIPAATAFNPDLVIVSAGFDAHEKDPLASVYVTTEGFGRLTDLVMRLADDCCGGRLVSALEGGYSLEGVSESVVKHLEHLGA